MAPNICMIGLAAHEVTSVKQLVTLLRNPDPTVGELARVALEHLQQMASLPRKNFSGTIPHRTRENLV
jgi:hypothetical protein